MIQAGDRVRHKWNEFGEGVVRQTDVGRFNDCAIVQWPTAGLLTHYVYNLVELSLNKPISKVFL